MKIRSLYFHNFRSFRGPVTISFCDDLTGEPRPITAIVLIVGDLERRSRMGLVCLIDEPELSLHPTLQHALVHHLRAFARETGGQCILATHSLDIARALPGATLFLDRLEGGFAARPVVGADVAA